MLVALPAARGDIDAEVISPQTGHLKAYYILKISPIWTVKTKKTHNVSNFTNNKGTAAFWWAGSKHELLINYKPQIQLCL
ncbi:hypothetical protein, partial [Enterobacter intestinihominis]